MKRGRFLLLAVLLAGCSESSDPAGLLGYDPPGPDGAYFDDEGPPDDGELPPPDGAQRDDGAEPPGGSDASAADPGPPSPISVADEAAMLELTNSARAAIGLAPLQPYWDLIDDARSQTVAMIGAGALFHNENLADVTSTPHFKLAENVGFGGSPAALQAAFMASPGHRDNLLDPAHNYVGIGGIRSGTQLWVTLVFMHAPTTGLQHSLPPFTDDDGTIFEASIKKIYDGWRTPARPRSRARSVSTY